MKGDICYQIRDKEAPLDKNNTWMAVEQLCDGQEFGKSCFSFKDTHKPAFPWLISQRSYAGRRCGMKQCSNSAAKCCGRLNWVHRMNNNNEATQSLSLRSLYWKKKEVEITRCGQVILCLNSVNCIFRFTVRTRLVQWHWTWHSFFGPGSFIPV